MKHAPVIFFSAVVALAFALHWYEGRSIAAPRPSCVESARILTPMSDAFQCAPGATIEVSVIRLAVDYAAVECKCPASHGVVVNIGGTRL
jgi:hypothetical protein